MGAIRRCVDHSHIEFHRAVITEYREWGPKIESTLPGRRGVLAESTIRIITSTSKEAWMIRVSPYGDRHVAAVSDFRERVDIVKKFLPTVSNRCLTFESP
jgi:hypothetical protein